MTKRTPRKHPGAVKAALLKEHHIGKVPVSDVCLISTRQLELLAAEYTRRTTTRGCRSRPPEEAGGLTLGENAERESAGRVEAETFDTGASRMFAARGKTRSRQCTSRRAG
jgi:hypothetical protein